MTFYRQPRVFLSYRHVERTGLFSRSYNDQHRAWITSFVDALHAWNVDVIWDGRMQKMFRPYSKVDPAELPFLAELSTLCMHSVQAFLPVLTSGYLERVGGDTQPVHGAVTEEWRQAKIEADKRKLEFIAIVREWPIPNCALPPAPISNNGAWDFRFVAATQDETELLCECLHVLWAVERPPIDMPFGDLVRAYTRFLVEDWGLSWPGVENWDCNFSRPDVFLEVWRQSGGLGSLPSGAGVQRDLAENATLASTPRVYSDELPDADDAEQDAAMEAAATALARQVVTAHMDRHRKPFDFGSRKPGGRASSGLDFGPTRKGFSYRA